MSVTCRNQGTALPERACGYCHEGPCPWDEFVIMRRPDFEALDEEWALADDPFFRPLKLVEVEYPAAPQVAPEPERCPTCKASARHLHNLASGMWCWNAWHRPALEGEQG